MRRKEGRYVMGKPRSKKIENFKKHLNAKEIAEYLCSSEDSIYTMVSKGEIPYMKIVSKIRVNILFRLETINRWLDEKKENPIRK